MILKRQQITNPLHMKPGTTNTQVNLQANDIV